MERGGGIMYRKNKNLRRKDNVVMFPGTFEKLIESGLRYVERKDYEQAVIAFDQAIQYEPHYPQLLGPYAIALYETRQFERAYEITSQLLQTGATDYINTMELYLTIGIQLQKYDEVEMTIELLYEEKIIPPELEQKFDYLRELNNRLARRYPTMEELPFTFEEFCAMDLVMQQQELASMEGTSLQPAIPLLIQIVESTQFPPLIVSFALLLLREAQCEQTITVKKFGQQIEIVPAKLTLPNEHPMVQNVLVTIADLLGQNPSQLELANSLVEKFAILTYPLTWGDYEADEIAQVYVDYINGMFTGNKIYETELTRLIMLVESEVEI